MATPPTTTPNTITVTACDNELIVLAYQPTGSYLLCDIQSGNVNAVNVTLTIQEGAYGGSILLNGVNSALSESMSVNLPAGEYSLMLLGINWGLATEFSVDVNGTTYALPRDPNTTEGLHFHPDPISITV
jgi:hypothetical protein